MPQFRLLILFPEPDPVHGSIWQFAELRKQACLLIQAHIKKIQHYDAVQAIDEPAGGKLFNISFLNNADILADIDEECPLLLQNIPSEILREVAARNFVVANACMQADRMWRVGIDIATKLKDQERNAEEWCVKHHPHSLYFHLQSRAAVKEINEFFAGIPEVTSSRRALLEWNALTLCEHSKFRSDLSPDSINTIFCSMRTTKQVQGFIEYLNPTVGWNLVKYHYRTIKDMVINSLAQHPQLLGLLLESKTLEWLGLDFPKDLSDHFTDGNIHLIEATVRCSHLWSAWQAKPVVELEQEHPLMRAKRQLDVASNPKKLPFAKKNDFLQSIRAALQENTDISADILIGIAYSAESRKLFSEAEQAALIKRSPHIFEQWIPCNPFRRQYIQGDPKRFSTILIEPLRAWTLDKIFADKTVDELGAMFSAPADSDSHKLLTILTQYSRVQGHLQVWALEDGMRGEHVVLALPDETQKASVLTGSAALARKVLRMINSDKFRQEILRSSDADLEIPNLTVILEFFADSDERALISRVNIKIYNVF